MVKCSPVRSAAHFLDAALRLGRRTSWDYQPLSDVSQQYVRNTKTLDELEAAARFPRVAQE